MTVTTTVILTGTTTSWTVPSNFVSLVSVEAIGGGCPGNSGFQGAVDLETLHVPFSTYADYAGTFADGYAGPGGYYCKSTTSTVPFVPGQVLNLSIAASVSGNINAGVWANKFFAGVPPNCLSNDTWVKDNGGNYIVLAPGGDSSSSPHGTTVISGGRQESTGTKLRSSAGGGAAGGPAGASDGQTQDGAESGFINPTQIKLFGSGGGSGNITQSAGDPGIGTRTAAGSGGGSGASAGGAGGNITGAAAASSSLLLPSLASPAASDAVTTNTAFHFGSGDFTIELWWQGDFQALTTAGTLLSCWDTNGQRSWMLNMGSSGGDAASPSFAISTDGSAETFFLFRKNPVLGTTYTSGPYLGPPVNSLGWAHIAICRASGALRMFVDGYPGTDPGDSTHYTIADANTYFASTANLTIGATLASGVVNTSGGAQSNQTPMPGWYGNARITIGAALYTCAATSGTPLGQQFTPPSAALVGGNFLCNWPGSKGATSSTATGATLTFVGAAVIDSDQYCYPPAVPEVGGGGTPGAAGLLWTDSVSAVTAGPGGGGGGGGGDLSRYRMTQGGTGGDGGLYGGGGGQGGGINSGVYVGLGTQSTPGQGGAGAAGVIVVTYNATPPANPARDAYYIERMDDRLWNNIEDAWCLDAALQYPMPTPAANLTAGSATGNATIGSCTVVNGGTGYTAPIAQVLDLNPNGGSGASVSLTISGGVITVATPTAHGSGYINPVVKVMDTTGTGAFVQPVISNTTSFVADGAVFTSSNIGSVLRMGGGKAVITAYTDPFTLTGNITSPITAVTPNDPFSTPLTQESGNWTLTVPVTTVSGLDHLEGMSVSALADGGVVGNLTVVAGSVTLPVSASSIVVGLPFIAQLQTLYMEPPAGGGTAQTRRKDVVQTVVRVQNSALPEVGVNQPDQAAQPNNANVPWTSGPPNGMTDVRGRSVTTPPGQANPLFTGDLDITNVFGGWDARGQIAVQQKQPVPLTVLALVPYLTVGDSGG